MILTRALSPACIKVPLEGMDKDSIITELVDLLDENGSLLDRDGTLDEVLTREQIRSTGVGFGIAIPHGRCKAVREPAIAVGTTHTPVDFDSVDSKPVSIVVLLLSPAEQAGPHIQALARVSRMMLDAEFRESLESAPSAEAAYELFVAAEKLGAGHRPRQVAAVS